MTPQNKLYEAAKNYLKPQNTFEEDDAAYDALQQAVIAYEQEQPCVNFEQSNDSTSATICKHYGKEKYTHYCGESIEQPEAIAGEKTKEQILSEATGWVMTRLISHPGMCIMYGNEALQAMQLYASQQTSAKDKEIKELKERISIIKEKLPDNKIRDLNPIWVRDEIISELEKLIQK